MPTGLPTGDYALAALLLLLAGGCATTAVRLLYEKTYTPGISALIVATLFFVAGIKLPSSYLLSASLIAVAALVFLLTAIISWGEIKHRASNPRNRTALALFAALCFATYIIVYMNSLRNDIDIYVTRINPTHRASMRCPRAAGWRRPLASSRRTANRPKRRPRSSRKPGRMQRPHRINRVDAEALSAGQPTQEPLP
jgi:hypothetical protein